MPKSYSTASAWTFGKPDEALQQYKCQAKDMKDLMQLIPPTVNPILNWNLNTVPTPDKVSSWFRNDDHVVFYGPNSARVGKEIRPKSPLTYAELQTQIQKFLPYKNPAGSDGKKVAVVAPLLPPKYMAEMAVAIVTLLSQHPKGIALAPIDPNMPHPKLMAALEQLECSALVTTKEIYEQSLAEEDLVAERIQDIRLVEPSPRHPMTGVLYWKIVKHKPLTPAAFPDMPERPALLLRTSGTTSTPKLVPITAASLLYNATCLAASLELSPTDIGANIMPLFHIGGIACNLLTVLVSGTSMIMVPGPFESNTFLDALTGAGPTNNMASSEQNTQRLPSWYYGVPSMHKAILLTAKARFGGGTASNHNLRFIRNGAAHLPHTTAVELAHMFGTKVMPTYSMSECMPVCSSHDAPIATDPSSKDDLNILEIPRVGVPNDTVGMPIGSSMAVVDEQGQILPYGEIGEVCLKGPGVIHGYIGIPRTKSHTPDGIWFMTGDMGKLDRNGRLVLSGRSKEMIKRGGDQVWPNEVDSTMETVAGVRLAVSFGVPNELWGEEVQAAVILEESYADADKMVMTKKIGKKVAEELGVSAKPSQLLFLEGPEQLLKGATGKYLRTRMADHFGVKAVDTGALNALEALADVSTGATARGEAVRKATASFPKPSDALNGVRFLTACFVVHHHIGLYPNAPWLRVQAFSLNMSIFFMLAAFQTVTATRSEVRSSAAQFIGTKIGSLHAFFMLAQVLAMISYLMFHCGEKGFQREFEDQSCTELFAIYFPISIINLFTGLFSGISDLSNSPAWFQSCLYIYIMLFPFLDYHLRAKTNCYKKFVLIFNIALASVMWIFIIADTRLQFFLVSWLPGMVAAMICGYYFTEFGPTEEELLLQDREPGRARTLPLLKRGRFWGRVTDAMSIIFLLLVMYVGAEESCLSFGKEDFEEFRPDEEPRYEYTKGNKTYVVACDVTYDEYIDYSYSTVDHLGRWPTLLGVLIGQGRAAAPLVLLWLYGLAYGRGWTASVLNINLFQILAPFAYPLYLLHVPVARFYWMATRGGEAQYWWDIAAIFPFPFEYWEYFVIVGICLVLAHIFETYIVSYMLPYTIQGSLKIFQFLFDFGSTKKSVDAVALADADVFEQVQRMVVGLTGNPSVTGSTNLNELGLDSLGATALLGALRASVPAAKDLTMAELATCGTVGDLAGLLRG